MAKRIKSRAPADRVVAMPGSTHHDGQYRIRALPDYRLANLDEAQALLLGRPPAWTHLERFDPGEGPWSAKAAATNSWAQSFEFLREFHALAQFEAHRDVAIKASLGWSQAWLEEEQRSNWGHELLTLLQGEALWVTGRRVLNWLAHLVPLLKKASGELRSQVFRQIEKDLQRLIATQESLSLSQLFSLGGPSARGQWVRSVAILGVCEAIPDLVPKRAAGIALNELEQFIQPDGTYFDGDPVHTLSVAADLAMLPHNRSAQALLQRIKQALVVYRAGDGDLVDFGSGRHHAMLLQSVLAANTSEAPGPDPSGRLLLSAAMSRTAFEPFEAWLCAKPKPLPLGPALSIELAGEAVISGYDRGVASAVAFEPQTVSQALSASIRRRDDARIIHIEATRKLGCQKGGLIGGATCELTSIRTLSFDHAHRRISGEDAVFVKAGNGLRAGDFVHAVRFVIAPGSKAQISPDCQSVLIVTPQGHGVRFRAEGLDIALKSSFESDRNQTSPSPVWIEVYRAPEAVAGRDFVLRWHFEFEEFV